MYRKDDERVDLQAFPPFGGYSDPLGSRFGDQGPAQDKRGGLDVALARNDFGRW